MKINKVGIVSIICALFVISIALGLMLSSMGNKIHSKGLKVTDHEKITIYIFRGDGCPHCEEAIKYFKTVEDEYKDFIQYVTYETWNSEANHDFLGLVAKRFGEEKYGVPFIVIGDKHYVGYRTGSGVGMINYALEQYKNDDYKDIVKEIIETNNPSGIESKTLKEIEG